MSPNDHLGATETEDLERTEQFIRETYVTPIVRLACDEALRTGEWPEQVINRWLKEDGKKR